MQKNEDMPLLNDDTAKAALEMACNKYAEELFITAMDAYASGTGSVQQALRAWRFWRYLTGRDLSGMDINQQKDTQ